MPIRDKHKAPTRSHDDDLLLQASYLPLFSSARNETAVKSKLPTISPALCKSNQLTPERFRVLYESLGIDRPTVERWREWWLNTFERSAFWKEKRAQFSPPLDKDILPWSLWKVFGADRRDRLLNLLKFLSPLTTRSICLARTL